ncbi:hypothetical protein J6590_068610 [Homalodisca vitripennis]|nr:hypothetical protein J6590_068610 [Homalodisca vitripennis]
MEQRQQGIPSNLAPPLCLQSCKLGSAVGDVSLNPFVKLGCGPSGTAIARADLHILGRNGKKTRKCPLRPEKMEVLAKFDPVFVNVHDVSQDNAYGIRGICSQLSFILKGTIQHLTMSVLLKQGNQQDWPAAAVTARPQQISCQVGWPGTAVSPVRDNHRSNDQRRSCDGVSRSPIPLSARHARLYDRIPLL